MKIQNLTILLLSLTLVLCVPEETEPPFEDSVSFIPESEQRSLGDPNAGLDYLIYGDYISSGIPYDFFVENFPLESLNELEREGISSQVPYAFNAFKASNGVEVVAPNCFQCHAAYLNDSFILGLGNYASEYAQDQTAGLAFTEQAIIARYGKESLEWEAFEPFSRASQLTGPEIVTEVTGVNPADKLTAVLAAHRNPETLEWLDEPIYVVPDGLIPTDVPALWLMKKKHSLYYTGSGRGDQARLMTLAEILTMPDTTKAREVDLKFRDVFTFLKNIEAPKFPEEIDETLVADGSLLYADHCAKCHGVEDYPNLLIDLDYVGTDPELARANFAYVDFLDWYNSSWYSKGSNKARFEKTEGYIAPPLDGIWATAPYLHNGSVPDLQTLLNSAERPAFWQRLDQYDHEKVGWNYLEFNASAGSLIYDTSIKGYGNEGHEFGDVFDDQERQAVIEFLKTL